MVTPALFRAFSVAGIGPIPNNCQSTPATARLTIFARVFNPRFSAKESLVSKRAAAPIENGLLVAAVTVPFSMKAGFKLLILSTSGSRGPSSVSIVHSPYLSIEINSLSNFPSAIAAKAFLWELMANSSWSSREIFPFSANISAPSPIPM